MPGSSRHLILEPRSSASSAPERHRTNGAGTGCRPTGARAPDAGASGARVVRPSRRLSASGMVASRARSPEGMSRCPRPPTGGPAGGLARPIGKIYGAPAKKSGKHDVRREVQREVGMAGIPRQEVEREVAHDPSHDGRVPARHGARSVGGSLHTCDACARSACGVRAPVARPAGGARTRSPVPPLPARSDQPSGRPWGACGHLERSRWPSATQRPTVASTGRRGPPVVRPAGPRRRERPTTAPV